MKAVTVVEGFAWLLIVIGLLGALTPILDPVPVRLFIPLYALYALLAVCCVGYLAWQDFNQEVKR